MGPLGPGGFRRRGRRRGLVVGAAVGAGVARHSQRVADQNMVAEQQSEPTPAAVAPTVDPNQQFAQLEKLGQLKDQGILTQAEFDAKKAQILGL